MKGRTHRKQILLFLIAVMLPSLVLVALTLRMINQERELAQKRISDERLRMAREIGQHLLVRLENVKLQEISAASEWKHLPSKIDYVNPEVVLVSHVEKRQLVLPWEASQGIERFRRLLSEPDFVGRIRQAEREEFAKKDFNRAAELYRQTMNASKDSVQKGYARLLLARSLSKSNQNTEASKHYLKILAFPYSISDEYGIPLSLYAAGRLLENKDSYHNVLNHIQDELKELHWLSPAAHYLLLDLLDKILSNVSDMAAQEIARSCKHTINVHAQKLEQALNLQSDFQVLGLSVNQENQENRTLWVSYGENPWLVSLAFSLSARPPFLVAVDAQKILASLESDKGFKKTFPAEFSFVPESDPKGLSLGTNFKGLRIAFAANQEALFSKPWIIQPAFYLLALLLILGITSFGAYLLLRDVRRDIRMAEMRSQFVSSVSHELKTPLTAIRMFAETLRLGRSKDSKTQTEYLDTIVNETQRLTRLLNNVLDFSKIEQGKRIYRPETASLYEIIQSAARAMEYPLSQRGFTLNVKTDKGLPDVQVDRDALEQALLNLLHNAMKYSGESRDIDLRLQKKDGQARIQVIDHGIGIDPQEQKRIFEKFYRIRSPENERIVGTGLGLALVSHIVEAHEGQLEVESAPGKGSIFSIYLPLEHAS